MINKIGNWVFGSFFRTIGRLLVFILLGFIIANLVDFGALIDNFRITDLFFEKVEASTWRQEVVNWTDNNGNTLPQYYGQYIDFNYNTNYLEKKFVIQNKVNYPQGTRGVLISTIFRYFQFQQYLECYQYSVVSGGNQVCEKYTFNGHQNVSFSVSYNNGYNAYNCYWYDNTFTTTLDSQLVRGLLYCPLPTNVDARNISSINYTGNVSRQNNLSATDYPTYSIGFEKTIYFEVEGEQSIIDNQNQNTQQQMQQEQQHHNEIMDDNTTQADSEGQDFINNFSNNSHGLTGIITAPLNAIQSLSSATCTPLVLPLPFTNNKTLTLPCMNSIYTQYFGTFYTMYQGIILALISYWVCVRLFTLVKGFKDPEDDKIEVMDL